MRDTAIEWRPGPGIYGAGMAAFVVDELELGWRAAATMDDEVLGFGPLFDRMLWDEHWDRP